MCAWKQKYIVTKYLRSLIPLHGSRPDQNGSATASVAARVSECFHGYFAGEGAAEFLGRSKSEAEGHKEL